MFLYNFKCLLIKLLLYSNFYLKLSLMPTEGSLSQAVSKRRPKLHQLTLGKGVNRIRLRGYFTRCLMFFLLV